MRNLVGALAKRKLNRMIVASLQLSNIDYYWLTKSKKKWNHKAEKYEDIDEAKGLFWVNQNGENRTLYYDITVPLIKNNIDMILLSDSKDTPIKDSILKNENYIALGELKGGIDPAGADEHWKTAKTALDRIIKGFNSRKIKPSIFYIGAAIENKMAKEIYTQLNNGYFANAANLTKESHMSSITDWLIEL